MGTNRTKNLGLPPRMRIQKHKEDTYYYLEQGRNEKGKRKLISLGKNYIGALRKYADLVETFKKPPITVPELLTRWNTETCIDRPIGTRKDIDWSLPNLIAFFSNPTPAPLEAVAPHHIKLYLDWRAKGSEERKPAKVRGNREIAWFSAAWNWARERGITSAPNPCQGVSRNQERGRDIYVEDDEMAAIMAHADEPLREAIELAYLIGQRPGDLRQISEADIKEGCIEIEQDKTKMRIRISVEGELAQLITRIKTRKAAIRGPYSLSLLCDERGKPMGKYQLRSRFDKARLKAAQDAADEKAKARILSIQFRDFRAKAATDKREIAGLDGAQSLLGHTKQDMTEHYTRQRRGQRVTPVK